jgi:hypothetical protein
MRQTLAIQHMSFITKYKPFLLDKYLTLSNLGLSSCQGVWAGPAAEFGLLQAPGRQIACAGPSHGARRGRATTTCFPIRKGKTDVSTVGAMIGLVKQVVP